MIAITKKFTFAASHRLTNLPDNHKCHRLHGHNYTVTLCMETNMLDDNDMVFDYGDLKPFQRWLDEHWDHRHLGIGDVYDKKGNLTDPAVCSYIPTAENLAVSLFEEAKEMFGWRVTSVTVCETDGTSATARGAR